MISFAIKIWCVMREQSRMIWIGFWMKMRGNDKVKMRGNDKVKMRGNDKNERAEEEEEK